MRAGKLKDRTTLYSARTEGAQPTWPLIGKAWAGFQEPRSVGRGEQTGIRSVESTYVQMRYRPDIQQGQLMERQGMWYVVESVEPGFSRSELAVSARRIVGAVAQYKQRGEPATTEVLAFITRENVYVGPMSEPRMQIELFQPQLPYPWGRRGDTIALFGGTFTVEGVVEGSDNGVTLKVMVIS
jgi:hypothetical protein